MPRIARIIAPGYPHHITQRGNNRAAVFLDDEDRQTYLDIFANYAGKYSLQVWAYCLMDNHVHLLVVPGAEESLARGIGLTNQVYTQYLNRKLGRSGRVWQNRFFSCIVDSQEYLWSVARYIESNPVKANIITAAEDYRWSSARAHLLGTSDKLLSQPDWFETTERKAYADFMIETDLDTDNAIRTATSTGRPFGSELFIDEMEFKMNRTLRPKKPGRPRKIKSGECP